MVNLAVNMGLLPNGTGDEKEDGFLDTFTTWFGASTGSSQTDRLYQTLWSPEPDSNEPHELVGSMSTKDRKERIEQGLPKVMQGDFDMFSILAKRDILLGELKNMGRNGDRGPTADAIAAGEYEEIVPKRGFFTHALARSRSSTMWSDKFISFRIDKNVDSSESFSSLSQIFIEIKQHPISSCLERNIHIR